MDIFDDIAKSWLSLNSSVYIISTVENRQKLQDSLAQHFRLGVAAGASQDPAAGERELPDEVKKHRLGKRVMHRAEYPKEASDRNFSRKATAEDLVLLILWELWDCILSLPPEPYVEAYHAGCAAVRAYSYMANLKDKIASAHPPPSHGALAKQIDAITCRGCKEGWSRFFDEDRGNYNHSEPNGVPGMYPCTAKSAAILPLLAAERGKLERVRKLSEKWRAETESYPHTDRGLAAHRAVRLCASELDAVLSVTRPEPAEASSGKP